MDFLRLFESCPCLPTSAPAVTVNNTRYKILRLLGEGGFSYVYLVASTKNPENVYAMKKIHCPYGPNDATYTNAMREVKNYYRFAPLKSPYLVKPIDDAITVDANGGRTFYILLPYFEKSLQDVINANVLGSVAMDEQTVLNVFVGVLRGVKTMHHYKSRGSDSASDNDGETDAMLPLDDTDGLDALSSPTELHELCPYAHRDLKPANVMLSPEGLPVLVDFGSCSRARVTVTSRQQALSLTDFAQEHCTLPYRAPELLDVASNADITEATDIWSLGCILYACCFGFSPFEKLEIDQGANLNLAISQGKYEIPRDKGYSQQLLDVIASCLVVDATQRPTVDDLLGSCLEILQQHH